MSFQIAIRALAVWVIILLLAMLNGGLREALLIPKYGTTIGLFLSGISLSVFILVVAYLALPWLGARRSAHLFAIGLGWLVLTLVFEFSFGLWQGKSWQAMFEAYALTGGNLWPFVLLVTTLAPYLAGRLRGYA